MPKFRGYVTVFGYITVEGDDMYDADERARALNTEEVLALLVKQNDRVGSEVFDQEFPEEV